MLTRSSSESNTCAGVVALMVPDIFALGAAMGTPASLINFSATLCAGTRTAIVSSPALTSSETLQSFLRGKISVSGPGQK